MVRTAANYEFEMTGSNKMPLLCDGCRIVVRGKTRWVRAESVPRDLPDGSVVWEDVLTDITAQKEAEAKLARSETALRNMLNTLPFAVGICVVGESHRDPAATIIFLNRRFISLLGYTVVDIPTVEVWTTRAYPDGNYRREVFAWWDAAIRRLISGSNVSDTHESRVRIKDGSTRDFLISASPMEDRLIVGFRDVTVQRKAEREDAECKAQAQLILEKLTPHRYKIFQLIGRGMTSEEIGQALGITKQTVQCHRKHIAKKLGITHNGLIHRAVRHCQQTKAWESLEGKAVSETSRCS